MHPNELYNKCYFILLKTFNKEMCHCVWHKLKIKVSVNDTNETLAETCVAFAWETSNRPDKVRWMYDQHLGHAMGVLGFFDTLEPDIRLEGDGEVEIVPVLTH